MKPQHLLSSLGIPSNRKGYWFTSRSLELALEDENRLILLSRNLFPLVAAYYHTDIRCIERDIRTIIDNCWDSPSRKNLQEISPYALTYKPTVGEFLDILYWHLKKQHN